MATPQPPAATSQRSGRAGVIKRISGIRVRTRLVVMVAALAVLWLVSVGVALQGLSGDESKSNASAGVFAASEAGGAALRDWLVVADESNAVAALTYTRNAPGVATGIATSTAYVTKFQGEAVKELTLLARIAPEAPIRTSAQAIVGYLTLYNGFINRFLSEVREGNIAQAIKALEVESQTEAAKTYEGLTKIDVTLRANAHAITKQEASASSNAQLVLLLVVGIGLLAAAVAVALVIRSIVRPLGELQSAAHTIAQGDVSQTVAVSGRDEIGQVGEAFTEMSDYLQEMARAADRIAAGELDVEVHARSERDGLGVAFEKMSATLRQALGDRSCLDTLVERMESLRAGCLSDLHHGLESMAAGDLTVAVDSKTSPVPVEDGRSAGRLAEIFNAMLSKTDESLGSYSDMRQKLTIMLGEITATSSTVSSASQQMASTSDEAGRAVGEIAHSVGDVAAGAERQVSSVEGVRLLVEEVAEATRQSADQLTETGEAARQATDIAQGGIDAAEKASEAMAAVAEATGAASERISELGEKSERIGGIVATITGIAEQTNLLALNAAIEAARAGEQGRGFAVVAEEVRKLAEDSQQAAALIEGLIGEIQSETHRAVEAVELGAQRTQDGVQTVNEARGRFEDIGGSVTDMSQRINEVTTAIAQITASTQGILQSVSEVAAVAEQNSASSEEVSASTQQTSASTQEIAGSAQLLSGTADQLEQLVAQFTLAAA
jgi:methyl-accepting chemotaxis protein